MLKEKKLMCSRFYYPSNQRINKETQVWYTTKVASTRLDPLFLTGLTDAEGSFLVEIRKDPSYRAGWMIVARYSVVLHRKDE